MSYSCSCFLQLGVFSHFQLVPFWIINSYKDEQQPRAQVEITQYRCTVFMRIHMEFQNSLDVNVCVVGERVLLLWGRVWSFLPPSPHACIHFLAYISSHTYLMHTHFPSLPPHLGHFEKQAERMMNLLWQSASVSMSHHWNYLSAMFACVCVCCVCVCFKINFLSLLLIPFKAAGGKAAANILTHSWLESNLSLQWVKHYGGWVCTYDLAQISLNRNNDNVNIHIETMHMWIIMCWLIVSEIWEGGLMQTWILCLCL